VQGVQMPLYPPASHGALSGKRHPGHEHVPLCQPPTLHATDLTGDMGRSAPHDHRHIDAAGNSQITASSGTPRAECECAAGLQQYASPEGDGATTDEWREVGTG